MKLMEVGRCNAIRRTRMQDEYEAWRKANPKS